MTRFFILSSFLFLGELPVLLAGPVFPALRLIETQPYAPTSKILEIRGERGEPLPDEWLILLSDTSARSGVREVTVVDGKISSERTPLRGALEATSLMPIDSSKLSFDADQVFKAVEREAIKQEVGFNWIDYTLRMDSESHAPVWSVRLYDHMGAAVGSMQLSAQGGGIVSAFQIDPDAYSREESQPSGTRLGGIVGTAQNAANRTVTKVKNSTLRFIGNVQEVLVGERTIGPKEEEEE